jgi:hypothetical protein
MERQEGNKKTTLYNNGMLFAPDLRHFNIRTGHLIQELPSLCVSRGKGSAAYGPIVTLVASAGLLAPVRMVLQPRHSDTASWGNTINSAHVYL